MKFNFIVRVNPFDLALGIEARQPMDFNHPKDRKRASWKQERYRNGWKT
jgi:hypothetical protein